MVQTGIADPGRRIQPEEIIRPMTTSGTTAVGDVLARNPLLLSGGEFYAMRAALAVDYTWGIAGIAQAPGINGAVIPFMFEGTGLAALELTGPEAVAIGDPLFLDATAGSKRGLVTAATNGGAADSHAKVFAIAMEAVASTSGRVVIQVEFRGITGHGSVDHA